VENIKRILLTNGRILLPENRIIEGCLLVDGEQIAEVVTGAADGIDAERIDIENKLLIPGFIDAHTHLFQEGVETTRPDVSAAKSRTELLEMVREAAREYEKGEVIIASDFDESLWGDSTWPCREELDTVAGRNPLIVRRICGHIAIGNTLALEHISDEWSGVDRETGIMKEDVPLNLSRIFPPDVEKVRSGLKVVVNQANSLGITSIHEITKLGNVRFFEELAVAGGLTLNTRFYIRHIDLDGIREPDGGFGKTTFGGIKLFADGSIGARTAANTFEYSDTPGNQGTLIHGDDDLRSFVQRAEERGIQLAIHAIGDLAIGQVLDVYEQCVHPGNPLRHRIEHAELIDENDIERVARLGIVISAQPNFIKLWSQPQGMYEKVLGDHYPLNNPLGRMERRGITVAFGSDTMPLSPLLGIEGTVTAPFADQQMNLEKAILCYTRNSAQAGFSLKHEGEIAKGKEANLVVLDPEEMLICKTFYRGRCVFSV
jgi:predicted amidohydrolase YtcJ